MVNRFKGSGRGREGGAPATHKTDFRAHVTGGDWRHEADQIDLNSPLVGTVQSFLESLPTDNGTQTYVVQNVDFGTTISFSGSRVVLDCRSATEYGSIGFELNYTPENGADLSICVINNETRTPSISRLDFNTSGPGPKFFRNAIISDYHVPDPRPGAITEYKFKYISVLETFSFIDKTVSVYSLSYTSSYDIASIGATDNVTVQPQKAHSILKSINVPSFSTVRNLINDFVIYTPPVFSKNNQCCLAMADLGPIWSDDGSHWTPLASGGTSIIGIDGKMALADEGSSSVVFTVDIGGTTARLVTISRSNTFAPFGSGAASVALSGSASTVIYQGPASERFLAGTNSGIDIIESPYTVVTSNVLPGVNISDIARAPDGRVMAVEVSGNVYLSDTGLIASPSFSFQGVVGTNTEKVSYNRTYDIWVAITSTGSVRYSNDNGASWNAVFNISGDAGTINQIQMVGDCTVICTGSGSGGYGSIIFAIDPRVVGNWTTIIGGDNSSITSGTGGLGPEPNFIPGYWGISWIAGKLIATRRYNTSANGFSQYEGCSLSYLSSKDAGMYSLLDFDK